MHLVLARHGNTFDPGQPAVWVGARSDLPLVAKGLDQARAVGEGLRAAGLVPARIIAGPLKRTRETAALAAATLGVSPEAIEIDDGLREIDYGAWEGRSSDAIRAMGGADELAAWERDGVWPARAGWGLSREVHLDALASVLAGLGDEGPVLIVSSNGIFRLLGQMLDPGGPDRKMATGHVSLLAMSLDQAEILGWNLPPADLAGVVEDNRLRQMARHGAQP